MDKGWLEKNLDDNEFCRLYIKELEKDLEETRGERGLHWDRARELKVERNILRKELEEEHKRAQKCLDDADNMLVEAQSERDKLKAALKKIAEKSLCACWEVHGFGSPYIWIGCAPHNSDDPEEWCICCMAHEALKEKDK